MAVDSNVVVLFDGTSLEGWRGYNKDTVPGAWVIEDGCIKINGSGAGEAGARNGGDLIYAAEKFGNFELSFEWKVDKGSNSGVFYMIQEVPETPAYYSAPEYQILDNENHPDAKLGVDGNRTSASLYDMIPAKPQNANRTVSGIPVRSWFIKVPLFTIRMVRMYWNITFGLPEWQAMLDKSKFSKDKNAKAYELLTNCGGEQKEGYIGLQDHGDNVWYRNITVKKLD